MRLKLKNFLVLIILIYIPSVIYSSHHYYNKNKVLNKIFANRIKNEDIPQKFKALELGIKPYVPPEWLLKKEQIPDIYPIGSIPFSKKYYCNEGYGLINLSHDRFGLRNKDEKWNKVLNNSNIFVIGDDFAHGACVKDHQNITSLIEKNTKINTINLANKSNTGYEYAAILRSIVKPIINKSSQENIVLLIWGMSYGGYPNLNNNKEKLQKDLIPIVEFSSEDDIYPSKNYTENLSNLFERNTNQSSEEIIKNLVDSEYIEKFSKNFKNTSIYNILTLTAIRDKLKNYFAKSYNQKSIELLSQICKYPCIPVVSYIPESDFWTMYAQPKSFKKSIKEVSESFDILFIDGEKVINKFKLSNYSPKGPHLSIKGYEKYSNYISNELIKILDKN